MRSLLQDLHHGVAVMTRHAGATTAVVASLALAIGLNATFFSFLNAFLYRPLQLRDADRLVAVATRWDSQVENSHSSYPDYRDIARRHPLFEGVAANFYTAVGVNADAGPEVVLGQLASSSYFDVMGVRPALGRGFLPGEDAWPDGQQVAVISHRFWTNRFAARPDIIGRPLLVNNQSFTIVGVAAEGFVGPRPIFATDVWVPLSLASRILPFPISLEDRGSTWLIVTGRLKPGATLAQAQAAADSLAGALDEQQRAANGKHFVLFPITAMRVGLKDPLPPRTGFVTLLVLSLAGIVLLVACLNVASIQLAQTWDRRREIALRLSLGASRARVVRQLVTETLLLALAGGALGLLLAAWTVDLLLGLQPIIVEVPLSLQVPFDWRVFTYTAALSMASAVAAGVMPAAFCVRCGLFSALRDYGWTSQTRSRARLRHGLVIAQVALSTVLLVAGGLAIRSLHDVRSVDPGFDVTRALVVPVDLGFGHYDETAGRRFFAEARDAVARVPGVRSATLALDLPLGQMHIRNHFAVDGYTPGKNEDMALRFNAVGPGYFETLRIPIVRGRPFDERDRQDSQPVAVVSEAFVTKYFGGQDPIGRSLRTGGRSWSVVGVMRDGRYDRLDEPVQPYVCLPTSQFEYAARLILLVDTRRGDPGSQANVVVREINRMDPNLPIGRVVTGREFLRQPLQDTGGPGAFVWGPALLALVLAMVGLYGLVAYSVSQRTLEFGVRITLGAQASDVASLVIRQGVALMLVGSCIGLAASLAIWRVLAGLFYQVRPFDPLVFAAVLALLGACGALACYAPARRAVRLDPVHALRCE